MMRSKVDNVNLFAPLPNSGQHQHNILREVYIVASHNAYHTGELGILRRYGRRHNFSALTVGMLKQDFPTQRNGLVIAGLFAPNCTRPFISLTKKIISLTKNFISLRK
jgi:hypothetical protein